MLEAYSADSVSAFWKASFVRVMREIYEFNRNARSAGAFHAKRVQQSVYADCCRVRRAS
jgi:hypothetical protein